MLVVKKNRSADVLNVELSGVIDQSFDFVKSIGTDFKKVVIQLSGINRINSLGVLEWRKYFHKLRCDGVEIKFLNIPPPLIDQINSISEFILLKEIGSVAVPYHCDDCSENMLKSFTFDEIKNLDDKANSMPCSKCGARAEMDEFVDEYFSFLRV